MAESTEESAKQKEGKELSICQLASEAVIKEGLGAGRGQVTVGFIA